jgi:pyridoxine 5-phosphate synthase
MATTKEMFLKAKKFRPDWVCLVPEKREELTTEGGLDLIGIKKRSIWSGKNLEQAIAELQSLGIEVSAFIEPDLLQVHCAFEMGCDAVEFHTGKWVRLNKSAKKKEWNRLKDAATLSESLGVRVHAGHGLDFEHAKMIQELPHLREVNIGHSLVCYAIVDGLKLAVKKMKVKLR